MAERVRGWLAERLPLQALADALRHKTVPKSGPGPYFCCITGQVLARRTKASSSS